MQRNAQLLHRKTVVDLQGEMVQEDSLVPFEKKPVFYLTDCLLLPLSLLVLLRNRLVYILLLALVGVSGLDHRYLLLFKVISHLNLLDNLLVLEVYRVHFSRHIQFIL